MIDVGDDYAPHVRPRFRGIEGALGLFFHWFPVDELETMRLYPSFLRTALRDLPQTVQHIVHRDMG